MNYYDSLDDLIKAYFKILSNDFPVWLNDYINTKEMLRIGGTSLSCGVCYSGLFKQDYFYSNLDHSVGVALIIWNFTHDKKASLAGLFHDIANPSFKHSIDFMNGDYKKQESTEKRTVSIIKNSKEIVDLLKRDNINIEDVIDYKMYPIADNKAPKLSADRLEYNFSSGLTFKKIWTLDDIKKIYNDLTVVKNEDNILELAFKTYDICEYYVLNASLLWQLWISDEDKIVMQFIGDICKYMNNKGYLKIDDLYTLSEKDIINIILNSNDKYLIKAFNNLLNVNKVYISNIKVFNKYVVSINPKLRYVTPLVIINNKIKRIDKVSIKVNNRINNLKKLSSDKHFTYFDFNFISN